MEDFKRRIKELEFELAKYKAAHEIAGIDFFDINMATGEANQSDNLVEKMGYTKEEMNSFEKRNQTFNPSDLQESLIEVEKLAKGEIAHTDLLFRVYGKEGDLFWFKHDGLMMHNNLTGHPHFVGVLRDITEEKTYLEELRHLASYDSLTDTHNRRSGLHKLETDIKDDTEVAVTYIDINRFKEVNDEYGHITGDRVLKELRNVIMKAIPESSYLIRLGGDEFLIVFLGQKIDKVEEIIRHIKGVPVMIGEDKKLTFSHGTMVYNKDKHPTIDVLIRDADEIMYREKYKK